MGKYIKFTEQDLIYSYIILIIYCVSWTSCIFKNILTYQNRETNLENFEKCY